MLTACQSKEFVLILKDPLAQVRNKTRPLPSGPRMHCGSYATTAACQLAQTRLLQLHTSSPDHTWSCFPSRQPLVQVSEGKWGLYVNAESQDGEPWFRTEITTKPQSEVYGKFPLSDMSTSLQFAVSSSRSAIKYDILRFISVYVCVCVCVCV